MSTFADMQNYFRLEINKYVVDLVNKILEKIEMQNNL
jgi:hypothetical protein